MLMNYQPSPVDRYVAAIQNGQSCDAAQLQHSAIAELRSLPAHCGASAVYERAAKLDAMVGAGWSAEALHMKISNPHV